MVDFVPPNEMTGQLNRLADQVNSSEGPADAASLSAPLNVFTGTMEILGGLVVVGSMGSTQKFIMTVPPQLPNYTVSDLNSLFPPSGATEGNIAFVTDAIAPTYRAALVGGGSVICLAFCDSVHWIAA